MKKLLWVGDAACPSGFARATHEILDTLRHVYDVTVLGINYNGDPHSYHKTTENPTGYDIYAAAPGGDVFGVGRLIWMCDKVKPDVIIVQQDGWNIPFYVKQLAQFPEYKDVPIVAIVAVDGKNFQGQWLDGISLAIFWTQFALDEARLGGYIGPAVVIPLGVDLTTYYPEDKREARANRGLEKIGDVFIVGNVNRNQPRKRWDLTIKYFAEWIKSQRIEDAFLYLHTAPTGDVGVDVNGLMRYYGVIEKLILMQPATFYGIPEAEMRDTYNSFDVCISTTQGEGMGLPAMEAMACEVECVLPDWSAYGDWACGAADLIECSSTCIGAPYVNVIGGVADQHRFTEALNRAYWSPGIRERFGASGLARVRENRFRWPVIGQAYVTALQELLGLARTDEQVGRATNPLPLEDAPHRPTEDEWADIGRAQETTA